MTRKDMTRKNMKTALSASLKAEDEAVKSRFALAETLLGNRSEATVALVDQSSKDRVIRDSFTLPAADYELISAIRQRCLNTAVNVTKSEVIRAGLHALNQLPDKDLLQVIECLAKVKTGRPKEKA
jgi:hypothetical protein